MIVRVSIVLSKAVVALTFRHVRWSCSELELVVPRELMVLNSGYWLD